MPSTIPYAPSLVLGSIVDDEALKTVKAISDLLQPVDAAQETLNSFIAMRRSLKMTADELVNMNITPTELLDQIDGVDQQVEKAAIDYATVRVEQELKLQPLRASMRLVNAQVESPLNLKRSVIQTLPLAADSLKMDAQYFSFDENEEFARNTTSNIRRFIAGSGRIGKSKVSAELARSAVEQINRQRQTHDISGTLVLTATCTHRNARVLAPLVIDVDKAIRIWNQLFKGAEDHLVNDIDAMQRVAARAGTADEKSLQIISGATYGSSFVGMVHVLRSEKSRSRQDMRADASTLQIKAETQNWWKSASGGLGVDSSNATDDKSLTSRQNIRSHVTVITAGCITGVKGTTIKSAVKQFAQADDGGMVGSLAALANLAQDEKQNLQTAAEQARTGKAMTDLKETTVSAVLTKLDQIEGSEMLMLDVNSLMTAFDNFVTKVREGAGGVPLNYYLHPITAGQLAQMWLSKYDPDKVIAIEGDDSKAADAGGAGAT